MMYVLFHCENEFVTPLIASLRWVTVEQPCRVNLAGIAAKYMHTINVNAHKIMVHVKTFSDTTSIVKVGQL